MVVIYCNKFIRRKNKHEKNNKKSSKWISDPHTQQIKKTFREKKILSKTTEDPKTKVLRFRWKFFPPVTFPSL